MISGFKKYICPFCYERFTADQIEFRVGDPRAHQSRDDKLSDYYDFEVKAGPIVSRQANRWSMITNKLVQPTRIMDKRTGFPADIRVCPNCHNPLPTYFDRIESKIISVVGARSSGKTHFITVLIDEIKKHGNQLGLSLFPQDIGIHENEFTTTRYKRLYYEPLFREKKELEQTQEAQKDHYPLIYELRSNGKYTGKVRSLYLVFYDTAGETFKSHETIERQAKYVSNSCGIIFLFDSFQVPHVTGTLKDRGYTIPASPGAFHEVLDQINQLLEKNRKAGPDKKAKIPLALTFSKIDALLKEGLIPSDTVLAEHSYHEMYQVYNDAEVEDVSDDIQSMLYNWGHTGFATDMEAVFDKYAYFGVSALGSTPQSGRIAEIKPHRILDPVLWILDQMNFPLPKEE